MSDKMRVTNECPKCGSILAFEKQTAKSDFTIEGIPLVTGDSYHLRYCAKCQPSEQNGVYVTSDGNSNA